MVDNYIFKVYTRLIITDKEDLIMEVGNIYKCKGDTNYIIIQEVNSDNTKYIVADSRFNYCNLEESPTLELKEELKDCELIN